MRSNKHPTRLPSKRRATTTTQRALKGQSVSSFSSLAATPQRVQSAGRSAHHVPTTDAFGRQISHGKKTSSQAVGQVSRRAFTSDGIFPTRSTFMPTLAQHTKQQFNKQVPSHKHRIQHTTTPKRALTTSLPSSSINGSTSISRLVAPVVRRPSSTPLFHIPAFQLSTAASDNDSDSDYDNSSAPDISQLRKGPIMPEYGRISKIQASIKPEPYYAGRLDELPLISQRMVDDEGMFTRSSPVLLNRAKKTHPEFDLDKRVLHMKHGDIDLFILPITQPDDTLVNHNAIENLMDVLEPEVMVVPLSKKPRSTDHLHSIFMTEITDDQLKYDVFNPEQEPPEISAGNYKVIESSQHAARLAYDRDIDVHLSGRLELVTFNNWKYKQFQSKSADSKRVVLRIRQDTTNDDLANSLMLSILPHTHHLNLLTEITMAFEPALVATASIRSALEEQQKLHENDKLSGDDTKQRRVVALLDTAHLRHFENTFDLINLLDENDFTYLKHGYDAYLANSQLEAPRSFLEDQGELKNSLEFPLLVSRALDTEYASKPFSNIHLLFTSIYGPVAAPDGQTGCGKCEMTFDELNLYKPNCRSPQLINRSRCSRPFAWYSIPEVTRFPPFGPDETNALFNRWMKMRHALSDLESRGIEVDTAENIDISDSDDDSGNESARSESESDLESGDNTKQSKARSRYNEFRRATDHISSKLTSSKSKSDDEFEQLQKEREQMRRELQELRKQKDLLDVTKRKSTFDSSFKTATENKANSSKNDDDSDDEDDNQKKDGKGQGDSSSSMKPPSTGNDGSSQNQRAFASTPIDLISVSPSLFSASKMTAFHTSPKQQASIDSIFSQKRFFSFNPLAGLTSMLTGGANTTPKTDGPVEQTEIMNLMFRFMKTLQSGQQLSDADHAEIESCLNRIEKYNDKKLPAEMTVLLTKIKNRERVTPDELMQITGISPQTLERMVQLTHDFKSGKVNQMNYMMELMKIAQELQKNKKM